MIVSIAAVTIGLVHFTGLAQLVFPLTINAGASAAVSVPETQPGCGSGSDNVFPEPFAMESSHSDALTATH